MTFERLNEEEKDAFMKEMRISGWIDELMDG